MKRLFKDVTVLIADGVPDSEGEIFDATTRIELYDGWISVRLDFNMNKPVGRARLRRDSNRVLADIEVLEEFVRPGLTPAVGGNYKGLVGPRYTPEERSFPGHVEGIEINHLALLSPGERNADRRIEPLEWNASSAALIIEEGQ